jgi:hypothetical protein
MGSGVLFLSRCERNNEINEFLDVSSVSSPTSEWFVPLVTRSGCFLFPVLMDGPSCSGPARLLIFVGCFGQGSAPHDHGVICVRKAENAHARILRVIMNQIRSFCYDALNPTKILIFINNQYLTVSYCVLSF